LLQFDVIPGNVVNFYNIKAETEWRKIPEIALTKGSELYKMPAHVRLWVE
jgi:hypothetical protein